MRGPIWRSAAALAGPGATMLILLALAYRPVVLEGWGIDGKVRDPLRGPDGDGLLQAMGLILNLLPIPGLDGFGAIAPVPAGQPCAPHPQGEGW